MTTKTLPQQARIVAGMIALGEHTAWGRDTELLIQLADQVEALTKERDALALGVDQWRVDYHELRLECDALAADAERYRWMTLHIVSGDMEELEKAFLTIGEEKESITQSEFDAVIDAAIKEAGVQ